MVTLAIVPWQHQYFESGGGGGTSRGQDLEFVGWGDRQKKREKRIKAEKHKKRGGGVGKVSSLLIALPNRINKRSPLPT